MNNDERKFRPTIDRRNNNITNTGTPVSSTPTQKNSQRKNINYNNQNSGNTISSTKENSTFPTNNNLPQPSVYKAYNPPNHSKILLAIIGILLFIIIALLINNNFHNRSDNDSISIESNIPTSVNNSPDYSISASSSNTATVSEGNQSADNVIILGRDIKAFDSGIYYSDDIDAENSFNLGGISYSDGFLIGTYPDGGYATFNLNADYSYISGVAGNLDNINYSVSYVFYGDDSFIGTVDIKGGALPIDFCFDITGVKQLKIVADGDSNYGNAVGFANVVLSNEKVKSKGDNTIASSSLAYLGKEIHSYDHGTYYMETNGETKICLGGLEYHTGILIGTYPDGGYASYNLEGKYRFFSGIAGNVDYTNYEVSYAVYGDEKLIGTVDVTGGGLPTPFNFDVSNVKQLKIVADGDSNYGNGVGFANAVVYSEENQKPELYTKTNYPEKAFLGKDIIAYQNGTYYKDCSKDGEKVIIQGDKFYNGFSLGTYPSGAYAFFNLNGEFSSLSGKAGFTDQVYPLNYIVYGDDTVIGKISLSDSSINNFSFTISGVKQLKIVADGNSNYGNAVSFTDVVVQK